MDPRELLKKYEEEMKNPKIKTPIVKGWIDGIHFVFWCPFCHKEHRHGAAVLGDRVAHCAHDTHSPFIKTGYVLALYKKEKDSVS